MHPQNSSDAGGGWSSSGGASSSVPSPAEDGNGGGGVIAEGGHWLMWRTAKPYFTRTEIECYVKQSRGNLAAHRYYATKTNGIGFIAAVGDRLGLFYLFHSVKEFTVHEICVTCLFVATKIEETHKKLKDILLAAHRVRHPKGPDMNPDGQTMQEQLRRVIGYERMVLETICFDFQIDHPFWYLHKMIAEIGGTQAVAWKAWQILIESYKTMACLQFPAHTIAAAAIFLGTLFLRQDFMPKTVSDVSWTQMCGSRMCDIIDICHMIVDSYLDRSQKPGEPTITELTNIKITLNQQTFVRDEGVTATATATQMPNGRQDADDDADGTEPQFNDNTRIEAVRYSFI